MQNLAEADIWPHLSFQMIIPGKAGDPLYLNAIHPEWNCVSHSGLTLHRSMTRNSIGELVTPWPSDIYIGVVFHSVLKATTSLQLKAVGWTGQSQRRAQTMTDGVVSHIKMWRKEVTGCVCACVRVHMCAIYCVVLCQYILLPGCFLDCVMSSDWAGLVWTATASMRVEPLFSSYSSSSMR